MNATHTQLCTLVGVLRQQAADSVKESDQCWERGHRAESHVKTGVAEGLRRAANQLEDLMATPDND